MSTPLLAYPVAKAAKAKSATTKATGAATKAAGKVTKKTAVAKKAPAKRVGVVAKRPASKVVKPKGAFYSFFLCEVAGRRELMMFIMCFRL